MNLQPLYDVKDRLEQAAVAGTGLLGEDFRLRRAREALAPLAAASPVFARIAAGLDGLLSAPPEKRGGQLLDLLALVNAVAYTQGSAGCPGPLEPLAPGPGRCEPVPYGQLQPLLEALTGTGSGRMNLIQSSWEAHPEIFSDYRVLPALVAGLGEGYAELAELNQTILAAQGPAVVPLLKAGFDPAGGKAMARRVNLMARLAGEAENDFYLAQLPQAQKEVRTALICALRNSPGNLPRLLELCQTERKGERQNLACRVLAWVDAPEAEAFLARRLEKQFDQAVADLVDCTSPLASRLVGRCILQELAPFEADSAAPIPEQTARRLGALWEALKGKTGPEIAEVYRRSAALGTALNRPVTPEAPADPEKQKKPKAKPLRFAYPGRYQQEMPFEEAMPHQLVATLTARPDPELCGLALELYGQYGERWLAPALAAQLINLDSAGAYLWAEEQLYKKGLLGRKTRTEALPAFRLVLGRLAWFGDRGTYGFSSWQTDPAGQQWQTVQPVALLDLRWFDLLAETSTLGSTVIQLLSGRDRVPGLSRQVLLSLSRTAQSAASCQMVIRLVEILSAQGWQEWENFLPRWGEHLGYVPNWWEAEYILGKLPLSNREKAAQLRALDAVIRGRRQSNKNRWPDTPVQAEIARLEQLAREEEGGTPHV